MPKTNGNGEIGLKEAIIMARGASTGSVTMMSKKPKFQLGLGSNVEAIVRNILGMSKRERAKVLCVLQNHLGGVTINC